MTDTGGGVGFLATDVPASWAASPSAYTDLNAPVTVATGTSIYPILDPAATHNVPGISVDAGAEVSMPVAWLYQLRDGTLGSPSLATPTNPIVGRVAFWTDDNTCRIDINTAGSPSPWNTPRGNSAQDTAWSTMQPAAGEYVAYPGHPASTSLSLVFGGTLAGLSPSQVLALTPRYLPGGSQFETVATSVVETVPPKSDRLYASVDELCYGTAIVNGQRQANALSPNVLNVARFALTAHSEAPETTMLGEPRVAIWPVADSPTRTTAVDRAITNAATIGAGTGTMRSYYFQRGNPLDPQDDFTTNTASPTAAAESNVQLFDDLINRGSVAQPGCGATFSGKYPGAAWPQLLLEIADDIHALNAIDANPAVTPFAAASASGIGYGYVDPLQWTSGSGASAMTLRGFGRSPTLQSLTLVFYVCGFGFSDGTSIDFDSAPDEGGSVWAANFQPSSTKWATVRSELVRAFVVPSTFHPGCGFPEVSDACTVQIQGLNGLTVSSGTSTGGFGFAASITSPPLGTPMTKLPADRAWGGADGPLAWRLAQDAAAAGSTSTYAFAGTKAFALPMSSTASNKLTPNQAHAAWPPVNVLNFPALNGVTVSFVDTAGHTLQTITLNLPAFIANAPTISGECDHADTNSANVSDTGWTTNTANVVAPSWYMSLSHRLRASPASRALMIQAGDISRSVECATDLRVVAGLSSVPATLFQPHPDYTLNAFNGQGGTHAHNLRFADGSSACFAPGQTKSTDHVTSVDSANALTSLVSNAAYPAPSSLLITVPSWYSGGNIAYYSRFTAPPCSVPTGTGSVTLNSGTITAPGDWDSGPGFAADGAQINLPDAGSSLDPTTAYRSLSSGLPSSATRRSPNALVPSPGIFGSLPTGLPSGAAWQTLLLCPYPAANTNAPPYALHPGTANPPDHLVLDNFWMPVVEPYPISTRMATAGKINLNDQIAPFTYIHRSTGLRALLDSVRVPAIDANLAASYKTASATPISIWNSVDDDATIAQIENRFANGSADAYLSESEICTVPIVPQVTPSLHVGNVAADQAALAPFWNGTATTLGAGQLTGDNLRELPYAQLYSRLTTRSNSYTVYVRAQSLQKLPADPQQNVWREGVDLIKGEWRGAYEIERYLDPAAPAPAAGSPLGAYRIRVVSARQFTP